MIQVGTITTFKSFTEMLRVLPNDNACREYLEAKIWSAGRACPHCGSMKSYTLKTKGVFIGNYKCVDCQKRYNVKDCTMFEGSHIGLHKWFIAIYIFSMHKKGISSHQLASDLGITQKSAWFMLHRIRFAFKENSLANNENAVYEIDATYVGGKMKNMHSKKRKEASEKYGYMGNKTVVLGILERDGNVLTNIVKGENKESVTPIIADNMYQDATIVTDSNATYDMLNKEFTHEVVNHSQGEYVRGQFHTNSIEGFWSQMKRGIYGIYHKVSPKHLDRYCHEFAYRYNVRKQSVNTKFDFSILHSERLKYSTLIAN